MFSRPHTNHSSSPRQPRQRNSSNEALGIHKLISSRSTSVLPPPKATNTKLTSSVERLYKHKRNSLPLKSLSDLPKDGSREARLPLPSTYERPSHQHSSSSESQTLSPTFLEHVNGTCNRAVGITSVVIYSVILCSAASQNKWESKSDLSDASVTTHSGSPFSSGRSMHTHF